MKLYDDRKEENRGNNDINLFGVVWLFITKFISFDF